MALICGGGKGCGSFLLLSRDGKLVTQHFVRTDTSVTSQKWLLSERLDSELHSIAIMREEDAMRTCKAISAEWFQNQNSAWALYAVTAQHEVVSLCPSEGRLEPINVLVDASGMTPKHQELSGLSVGCDGSFWLLAHDQDKGATQVRSWSFDGNLRQVWDVLPDRRWSPGLCLVEGGQSVLLVGSQWTQGKSHPELWHFDSAPREGSFLNRVTTPWVGFEVEHPKTLIV